MCGAQLTKKILFLVNIKFFKYSSGIHITLVCTSAKWVFFLVKYSLLSWIPVKLVCKMGWRLVMLSKKVIIITRYDMTLHKIYFYTYTSCFILIYLLFSPSSFHLHLTHLLFFLLLSSNKLHKKIQQLNALICVRVGRGHMFQVSLCEKPRTYKYL